MLDEVHRELDRRYIELRDSRLGPVFFIEHGLSENEVDDLVTDVSQAMNAHPPESGWWQTRHLPLIVVATEIGYRYRGTGTDYWPRLEAELEVHISLAGRQQIRDLFATASEVYRGAEPPDTSWAQAFHLIAWPITHALVPLEFHRPFALTLANLSANITGLSDENLHRAIRIAASQFSARFYSLLEDSSLVVAVARGLLGDSNVELSAETLQRIKADLERDQVARRGVATARRIQRTTADRIQTKPLPQVPTSRIAGQLELRRTNDGISIAALFPPLQADLQLKLRHVLRRHRYAPRLWGVSERIPSEQLLSGAPFPLKLTSAPSEDSELLPGLDEIVLDQELREVLAAFALDGFPPLLFAVSSDGERGWQLQGPNISGHRSYWLLSHKDSGPEGCPALGEVGPYICHLLDPTEETARDVLMHLGYQVRFGFSVEFAGVPPIDQNAPIPVFANGDQVLVVLKRAPQEGLRIEFGDEQVLLPCDDVLSIVVEKGDHLLRVSDTEETREFAFRGTPPSSFSPRSICSIALRSGDLSLQALLEGTLSFSVDSFAPLQGLEITVEIRALGQKIYATVPLSQVPCTIASNQEPFITLLDDQARELLFQTSAVVLQLRVGSLCTFTVELERRIRPCWWVTGTEGHLKLTSELGDLSFGEVSATAPHLPPIAGGSEQDSFATLLAPIGLDSSEFGGAAPFTTFCSAPTTSGLEKLLIEKPRLLRRLRGERGSPGVGDLVEAYLRWSLAETENLIAEVRRNQIANEIDSWISEVCCGSLWREQELSIRQTSPWECLVKSAEKAGLGRDAYVDLPGSVWRQVLEVATRQLRRQLPELWELVRPPYDLGEQDWQVIETVFEHAYKMVSDEHGSRGNESTFHALADADFTADNKPETWQALFESIVEQQEMHRLVSLLVPTDAALALEAIDASGLPLKELSEEFEGWVSTCRRAFVTSPSGADLNAILALWAEPEVAVNMGWREALSTLVADRGIARAARYLALKYRHPRQGF